MTGRLVAGTAAKMGRHTFVQPGSSSMRQVSYGRIRLGGAEQVGNVERRVEFRNAEAETGLVCVGGEGVVSVAGAKYRLVPGDALYVPRGTFLSVETETAVDVVECSAPVEGEYPVQFVSGDAQRRDPKLHFVSGGAGSGAQREIDILLGSNVQAGRLVVGITRSLPGNWTSWPPHEHAAMLEEIYVYFDMPEPDFGLQLVYTDGISAAEVEVVRDGDAVLLPAGYHPNVAIPGKTLNFVWIMAAHREVVDRQWGVVTVDPRYA